MCKHHAGLVVQDRMVYCLLLHCPALPTEQGPGVHDVTWVVCGAGRVTAETATERVELPRKRL